MHAIQVRSLSLTFWNSMNMYTIEDYIYVWYNPFDT